MLSKLITFNESTLIPPKLLAQEISKYQILWSEILNSMYIYIYKYSIALESEVEANMFLVDGSTLKAKLLRICEIIVDLYVHAVYDYILRINMGLFDIFRKKSKSAAETKPAVPKVRVLSRSHWSRQRHPRAECS